MKLLKRNWPIVGLVLSVFLFFDPFITKGKLPIPADAIVGLYHPFRDLYAKQYPNGIPFKNFLITDPVRQQYPWRELAVSTMKKWELPLWNPYSFSGTPLLANIQAAPFYPLNVFYFLLPFTSAWSILVVLQPILGALFLYLYLRYMNVSAIASFLGGFVFAFSGFSVAWMELGTILHSALWLPLVLLSIDKIFFNFQENSEFNPSTKLRTRMQSSKLKFKIKNCLWTAVFVFSLASSLFAGHLQTFFYVFGTSIAYLLARWWQHEKRKKVLFRFAIYYLLFAIITATQWIPTFQFIFESARDIDQADWQQEGWFIPWQHLIQFVVPDFFGNPTTLNYWGVWNYGEFIAYVGIVPLVFAIYALFFRRDKKTLFFGTVFFSSLIFALPTWFAKLPYMLHIPFISTTQSTRLLFLTDFSLAILAAFGFDFFMKKKKQMMYPILFMVCIFVGVWFSVHSGEMIKVQPENLLVAKRNLILPTIVFVTSSLFLMLMLSIKKRVYTIMIYIIIVGLTIFDLFRFGWKFIPFTNKEYLFPQTKLLSFLQKQKGQFRIMTTDNRILPPNFSLIYRLQSVDGYDPLYLRRYGELIAASERGKPDISAPFGFNRIITLHNYESKVIDLLGVKYVLSLSDLSSKKLKKVFQEGQTRVYENSEAMPRVFFAEELVGANTKQDAITTLLDETIDYWETAVVEKTKGDEAIPPRAAGIASGDARLRWKVGKANIVSHQENVVIIQTENEGDGFLVLTDSFFPTWHARIDGDETDIHLTNFNFRGVVVPKGKHTIEFYISLL